MIERHSIPWYTNRWGTLGGSQTASATSSWILLQTQKHQRETFGEIRSHKSSSTFAWSPQTSRTIAPSLVSTNFYSGNLTSNHKSSWLRDSSRLCIDHYLLTTTHNQRGLARNERYHENITTFSLFLGTNTSKSENARERDAKSSVHDKQTSSSALSALIGDFLLSRVLRSDTTKKTSHHCAQ